MKLNEFEKIKDQLISSGEIDEYKLNNCLQGNKIFVRQGIYAMSQKKIQSLIKIACVQKYYQCNPVRFISDWFNVELLDSQAWIVQQAWICPNVLLVASRGYGKSTIIDILTMAKAP